MAAQQAEHGSEDQVWRRGAWLGLATAAAVVTLRLVAWFLTHSLAVLADTVDPLLNVAAAMVTLFVLHSARRPADDAHPFGFRALEHVAVGAQGALALAGAGVVAWAAVHQWQAAVPVRLTLTAGVVFVASIALNAVVGRWQLLTGRRIGSPALRAAGRHAQLDAAVGLAVLVHLFVNSYQHHPWLDAGLGLVILGWVAVHALRLLRVAASGLIETARPVAYPRAEAALEDLLDDEIVGFHDLRCRDSGGYTYADFHIQFAPGTTLERAHELTTTAELAVQEAIGRCDAIGHLETAAEVRPSRDPQPPATGRDERARRAAARVSLTVAVVLMAIKGAAAVVTGSAAVLSDALESVVNVAGAGFATFSVALARSGTDRAHPYGHQKIEYLAAGFEAVLIGVAGVLVMAAAMTRLLKGAAVANIDQGLVLLLVATVANAALGAYLLRQGQRLGSLSLVADGKHVLTDVWTSAGVLAGLVVVWATGWQWADPVVAMIVALGILRTSWHLAHHALAGLLDTVRPEVLAKARAVLDEAVAAGEISDWHKLRLREVAERHFADCHILALPGATLPAAHSISEVLEQRLEAVLAPADVTIHAEPSTATLN